MRASRALNVVYVLTLISVVIITAFVLSYYSSPYMGTVQVSFHVQVIAYNQDGGDYAFVTFDGLMINFSRTMPQGVGNQTTTITAYAGNLHGPLSLGLNLTLSSQHDNIAMPTHDIEFTSPGIYAVSFVHIVQNISPSYYLVNLTYTESVHQNQPHQIWTSNVYYYQVE